MIENTFRLSTLEKAADLFYEEMQKKGRDAPWILEDISITNSQGLTSEDYEPFQKIIKKNSKGNFSSHKFLTAMLDEREKVGDSQAFTEDFYTSTELLGSAVNLKILEGVIKDSSKYDSIAKYVNNNLKLGRELIGRGYLKIEDFFPDYDEFKTNNEFYIKTMPNNFFGIDISVKRKFKNGTEIIQDYIFEKGKLKTNGLPVILGKNIPELSFYETENVDKAYVILNQKELLKFDENISFIKEKNPINSIYQKMTSKYQSLQKRIIE
jgi:hypothetical protein